LEIIEIKKTIARLLRTFVHKTFSRTSAVQLLKKIINRDEGQGRFVIRGFAK